MVHTSFGMKRGIEMKKITNYFFVLTVLFVLLTPALGHAGLDKLREGAVEFVTSPLEIGKQTAYYSKEIDAQPLGLLAGVLEGCGQTLSHSLKGLVKIFTFPFEEHY